MGEVCLGIEETHALLLKLLSFLLEFGIVKKLTNPKSKIMYVFPSLFFRRKSIGRGLYPAPEYSTSITICGLSILEGAPLAPLLAALGLGFPSGLLGVLFGPLSICFFSCYKEFFRRLTSAYSACIFCSSSLTVLWTCPSSVCALS